MNTKRSLKRLVSIILTSLICAVPSIAVYAQGISDFAVKDGVLLKYNGNAKEVEIPATLGIHTIGAEAFAENKKAVSVVVPAGVVDIGDRAFSECSNLSKISLPSTVTRIGSATFSATAITKMELPENLKEMGDAFGLCEKLESVDIPSGIKEIKPMTFYGCLKLKRLDLPQGLTKINSEAFYKCSSLETVKIPESVEYISNDAFYGADKVKIIGINNSYAHNFAKEAYRQPYTGESVPGFPKGIPFVAQSFVSKNTRVMVDGEEVSFMVYNINGNNYFKLRDVAQALKGTSKKFGIDWKGSKVDLVSNKEYESIGTELVLSSPEKSAAYITSIDLSRDGNQIDVKTYNLGGSTYFKLRDLGWILGFDVEWNGKMMVIDTRRG